MNAFLALFTNEVLWCAVCGWFAAQALKIPTYWLVEKKWDLTRCFGSGGMPSSHTAFVVALAIMTGWIAGLDSPEFAATVVLACIVMYDASGVRRETGLQAEVINAIIKKVFVNGEPITDVELKELIGHTKLEVIGGFIVGVLVALLFILI